MNGWFFTAGVLLLIAFFVHLFAGNRFYSSARPDQDSSRAYDAWLMGHCGMQMIGVDLLLAAGFLLASGCGLLPCPRTLELFFALIYGGWTLGWLFALAAERSSAYHYRRLRQWMLFLVVTALIGIGILAG